ncbi:MAG: enoyl-CoA hydratase-related protein [Pseudomonadota bacterium]
MSIYEQILFAVDDSIATITFNQPDVMNLWSAVMENEVRAAIADAVASAQVAAIVLTGAGRGFCAGADLRPGAKPVQLELGPGEHRFSFLENCAKPLVAAINGPAAGVGLSIALYCDFRYMAEGTKLTTAFARRGLIAEHGSAWLLPRLIGLQDALEMLIGGGVVTTAEAASMRLVRALPAEDFLPSAIARTRALVGESSPRSMRVIKRQVHDALTQSLVEAVADANREQAESVKSEDCREGIAAFRERRVADFTGH